MVSRFRGVNSMSYPDQSQNDGDVGMKKYAVLVTGEVTRSFSVTADSEGEARTEACNEWTRMVGGDRSTSEILLIMEEDKHILKTV